jgi:hypothetical protein
MALCILRPWQCRVTWILLDDSGHTGCALIPCICHRDGRASVTPDRLMWFNAVNSHLLVIQVLQGYWPLCTRQIRRERERCFVAGFTQLFKEKQRCQIEFFYRSGDGVTLLVERNVRARRLYAVTASANCLFVGVNSQSERVVSLPIHWVNRLT